MGVHTELTTVHNSLASSCAIVLKSPSKSNFPPPGCCCSLNTRKQKSPTNPTQPQSSIYTAPVQLYLRGGQQQVQRPQQETECGSHLPLKSDPSPHEGKSRCSVSRSRTIAPGPAGSTTIPSGRESARGLVGGGGGGRPLLELLGAAPPQNWEGWVGLGWGGEKGNK